MNKGGKDYEKVLQSLTVTIDREIGEGAKKTESLFSSACIYRVPKELRKLKESAYTPRLIAIGPLHWKDKHLDTPMKHVKLSYTNNLFCRLTEGMEKHPALAKKFKFEVLKECVAEMKILIGDAKKCYAEEVELNEQMMLVDGCFILELLYRFFSLPHKQEETLIKGGDSGKSKRPLGGEELLEEVELSKVAQPLEGEELLGAARPLGGEDSMQNTTLTQGPLGGEELLEEVEPTLEGVELSEGEELSGAARPLGGVEHIDSSKRQEKLRGEEFFEEEKRPYGIGVVRPLGGEEFSVGVAAPPLGGKEPLKVGVARPLGGEVRIEISERQKIVDPIFDCISTLNNIQHDLLLLENQIPFTVLEKLFQLTLNRIMKHPYKYSLNDFVSFYFGNMMSPERNSTKSHSETATCCSPASNLFVWVFGNQMNNYEEEEEKENRSTNYNHILHKLHADYLHPQQTKKKGQCHFELMPSASNLDYAGVKFVSRTGNNLFNAKFSEPKGLFWWCRRARFEIPPLGIYDPTESFLRNLIAFEQCCPEASQHFTSYAYLMDMLVNSEKDVEVLEKAGVVHNYLGASEDATNLFNKLCKEIVLGDFFFADMCKKVTAYSERCWPNDMAHVRRKYFASPWTFIAFFLAFIVFATTITQFVFSFLK